ncbi:tetratricopeptide repeat protein [Treponema rectale]|uniref:Tetratricopeptide repeat protein n=1 Tax=Treponema rectale TaxID=744512 RepID=A0A840SDL9_9SPIR|nr:tetratricopeptide repeat protein [Treponema rectale]MBB5218954.1 hypothetical protein [Treponema rectale]QOS41135.1 tetratricopeptide repeat protein [Treponema rectale]
MSFFRAICAAFLASAVCISCKPEPKGKILPAAFSESYTETQRLLMDILEEQDLEEKSRYVVVNKIAENMLSVNDYPSLITFLTQWVEEHPDDTYNAYWLLMTAYAYLENDAKPIAEYYFERIIGNYEDLLVQDKSIHFLSLQHLIQISKTPANRIYYFNQLINRFPNKISKTELYYRLALEYEKESEWSLALKTYTQFLDQPDASTIQIDGIPNAYLNAKQLVDFNNSPKDWTFETRDALVSAVKKAISSYNYNALERYKSKVNFFAMTWRSEETDENAQVGFTMHSYMLGNRIRYNAELDPSSTPTEAYLRTTGWSTYVNTWYLYFRKVNFPADPEIHGRWEWAGIYLGEKL